jgi:hypothetical protein
LHQAESYPRSTSRSFRLTLPVSSLPSCSHAAFPLNGKMTRAAASASTAILALLVSLLFFAQPTEAQFCHYDSIIYKGSKTGPKPWPSNANSSTTATCEPVAKSYIRPDVGGALQPWHLTAFQLLLHIPLFVVRVIKFDKAQLLSMLICALSIAITVQAYISTKFSAEKILVWMPITSVIDAGNALHIYFIIYEENRRRRVERKASAGSYTQLVPLATQHQGHSQATLNSMYTASAAAGGTTNSEPSMLKVVVHRAALFLFASLMAIQITGLIFALKHRFSGGFSVLQCSPAFNGYSLQTENCTLYTITPELNKGISCVYLPGIKQERWILNVIVILIIALACEVADLVLLRVAYSTKTMHKHLYKRPLLTFVCGLAILIALLVIGVGDTRALPDGMTTQVLIASNVTATDGGVVETVCSATLTGPGLRGNALEWSDGLFNSWGCNYYGC